jgi:hypothetical protein
MVEAFWRNKHERGSFTGAVVAMHIRGCSVRAGSSYYTVYPTCIKQTLSHPRIEFPSRPPIAVTPPSLFLPPGILDSFSKDQIQPKRLVAYLM